MLVVPAAYYLLRRRELPGLAAQRTKPAEGPA
jgi:hypothetical protein